MSDIEPAPEVQPSTGERRLVRSETDRMVLGVCGGLAAYFGVDPVLMRLAFVLITLAGGAGVLAYFVLAIVMPTESAVRADPSGAGDTVGYVRPHHRGQAAEVLGAVLLGVGLLALANELGWTPPINGDLVWPLLLVGLGVALLVRHGTRRAWSDQAPHTGGD